MSFVSAPITALDPGPVKTAYVALQGGTVIDSGIVENGVLRAFLGSRQAFVNSRLVAIEMIACYGMPVGRETFETCLAIGRFLQILSPAVSPVNREVRLIYRKDVKHFLCNSHKAKDANVWQALCDRFGGKEVAVGKKANPGPLYGIHSHERAALAVAVYAQNVEGETYPFHV